MKPDHLLKEIRVQDAVGLRLAHDLTRIVPGEFKGRAFRKGHVIAEEDIPRLLDLGKEHIYILDIPDGWVHEEDAALRMAAATAGAHIERTEPSEGKVTLKAAAAGMSVIDENFVHEANEIEHVVFSTIISGKAVKPGEALAATRVVPLLVEEETVVRFERLAQRYREKYRGRSPEHGAAAGNAAEGAAAGIVEVKPFRSLRAGVLTTGGEVFSGRIEDKFGPVLREKLAAFGSEVVEQRFSPDDTDSIAEGIRYFLDSGVDLVLVTGGMSVDPDDRTPGAIRMSGAEIVSYGTPMLPGSMMLFGYLPGGTPIFGLPGAVIYEPYTAFDALLPRVLAGVRVTRADITRLGYGGLLK